MIGKVPVIVAYGATEDIRDMMIQSRLGCQSPLATGQYFFLQHPEFLQHADALVKAPTICVNKLYKLVFQVYTAYLLVSVNDSLQVLAMDHNVVPYKLKASQVLTIMLEALSVFVFNKR